MRIAYIINSLDGYGAGLPIPMVTGFMRDAGADVRLFALARRDGRMEPMLTAAGLAFDVRPGGSPLTSFGWLKAKLEAYRPTVLWTSLAQATLIGRVMGVVLRKPVVSWQHNVFLKRGNIVALKLTRKLTDIWVADSECVAAVTRTRFGVPTEDVTVWPLFAADPDAPRARPALADEIFRLGSLGRLHPHKGYDILIQALGRIRQMQPSLCERFSVTIGGDGPERSTLEALVRTHGVTNLSFAGYQEHPRDFLATLHGYVQPSRVEGLCISAHEAMQAGLPTVVTHMGEMPLTVQDGRTGFIVPVGDIEALAAAIVRLVGDRTAAAAMGDAARTHVNDRFSRARFRAAGQSILDRAAQLVP